MNEMDKMNVIKRLGGWERMVVFSGVILTVPLFALLGTAIYSAMADRPDAHLGILLSVICLLVLWAIVWGALWIVSGFKNNGEMSIELTRLEELEQENERLKKLLAEMSADKGASGDSS